MINKLKSLSLYIMISILVTWTSDWLKSEFLDKFLLDNLVTLLIALTAINATTISVIMTKLREITQKNRVDFSKTIKAMKGSMVEQVSLIVTALLILVIKDSKLPEIQTPSLVFALRVLLVTVFTYAIQILYDTSCSIFVILRYENETAGKSEVKATNEENKNLTSPN